MKTIPLTRGEFALVDDGDWADLSRFRWRCAVDKSGVMYAVRSRPGGGLALMHREILNVTGEEMIDHIDGNGLNNQRGNLRACTNSQNQMNRRSSSSTGYKGVRRNGGRGWSASIQVGDNRVYLGAYAVPEDAAIAYNHAAAKHFGQFARFNEVEGWQDIAPERRYGAGRHGYLGVSAYRGRWVSQIWVDGKNVRLGYFDSPIAAAIAFDDASLSIDRPKGRGSRLNFPKECSCQDRPGAMRVGKGLERCCECYGVAR